jgi:peptidyl-prolyl cis-trans isomerase D
MLNVMRDNLRHLKWVLVVVAFAMLLYLGAYFDRGIRRGGTAPDWAARVDGHAISTQDFLQIARSQDDYYRKLLGGQYEPMKKNLKLGTQTIQGLVDRQLILSEARALGLKTTKEGISKAILENPDFKDPSGNFVGKERYADFIGQNFDGGVEGYELRIGEDLLAKRWIEIMTASARISDAEIEQAWRSRNVRSAADYVFVPAASVPADGNVDAAAIGAWYASHADRYKKPEARKVRLMVVERQAQMAKAKVSDADAKSDYDAHASEYTRPDQRRVRHILFKLPAEAGDAEKAAVREKAAGVLARAQKGEDFAAMARTMSQDAASAAQGGELGWFGRGSMVKPFEDAAFATAPGQFAPVVETSYGFHVLQVEESRAAGATPFDEVKDAIRRRLELQQAQTLATAEAQRLAAEVKKPADLDAVAAKAGLKLDERLVPGDEKDNALGPSPEFTTTVASMTPGQVSPPLAVARGLAIVACTEIVPSAVSPLSEVSDRVKADVLAERGRQAAYLTARRIAAGPSLADGAKPLKLEVKKSGDLSAGGDLPGVGRIPELDGVLFGAGGATGAKGSLLAPGGAIAYEVTRHDAFDPAKFEADKAALRNELIQQRRDQLTRGLIENLRQKHTIEINQPLVDGVNG